MGDRPALAVTAHDPGAHLLPGLKRVAGRVQELFSGVGALITEETSPAIESFLRVELGASIAREAADVAAIGRHRRISVDLARHCTSAGVLHSDLDHLLRWIEADHGEVSQCLRVGGTTDLLVVGRTQAAMDACPRRLRETERVVNHIHQLITGRAWDLMFAIRHLSPRACESIVRLGREDTLANDVEWPLLCESLGLEVDYLAASHLSYLTTEDFDGAGDTRDDDPELWIQRVEVLHLDALALRRFIARPEGPPPG
ncbi:MAG TPA: hypothetical protein VIA06_07175 [Candidatus Dormibacteraeota bacterium]|jgi:hypothetical protein|nr:hypothetical protein [Candidatus Dormibacteraeota bacterium]